jgi:hypothetical protein
MRRRATVVSSFFFFLGAPLSLAAAFDAQRGGPGLTGKRYTGSGCAIIRNHPKV